MRVHVLDPSAFTPPYDHALCRALGEVGVEVELFTSRFSYGSAATPRCYRSREFFYRHSHSRTLSGARTRRQLAWKLAEHIPDMLRYRRISTQADLVHFQWLTVQALDVHLLPQGRPLVLTAHDVMPREPRPFALRGQRRLYERMDAIVVHSHHGRSRLIDELGLDPDRVHVIPHGVLRPWEGRARLALPSELEDTGRPVVLFFGLLRPYKGLEVLLEAWRGITDADLWIVGMPRMDVRPLRAIAQPNVRFIERFVDDGEIPALMERACLVALPYLQIDQSGVLFTALGAGRPLLLTDAGGFPDLIASGAAEVVPAGDVGALHRTLRELLDDPARLQAMAAHALRAADGDYSWAAVALAHRRLYEHLL